MKTVYMNLDLVNKFFCFKPRLKIKAVFLMNLFICQESKPLEPLTFAIASVGVITARAFSKTATGKIFIGYVLGRASTTSAGKYLVARVQDRVKSSLQKRVQENILTSREQVDKKILAFRSRIAPLTLWIFGPCSVQASRVMHDATVFYNTINKSSCFKRSDEKVTDLKGDLEKVKFDAKKNESQATASTYAYFNQAHIRQEIKFGRGSTFVSVDAASVSEYGKKQFWKGVCVGGATGAVVTAWWEKNREERLTRYLLAE